MAKVLRKSHPATRHILLAEGVVSFIFWGEDFLPNLPTKDLGKWMDHDPNWFTCFFSIGFVQSPQKLRNHVTYLGGGFKDRLFSSLLGGR